MNQECSIPASRASCRAYRIIQEGLTNIARHAGVQDATVRVWAEQEMLRVQVEDRGGLTGMRQRATIVGGRPAPGGEPGEGAARP